jgi:hypothetical protein
LPCSSVCAIVLTMTASPTTVFPHEGTSTLPVHAHVRRTQITAHNAGWRSQFRFAVHTIWSRVPELWTFASMKRVFQLLHHRSLTASVVALFFALLSFAFLPEHSYRLQQQGAGYLTPASITALVSLVVCAFTLVVLLRDNRSGYPSMRCSLATLLWALACVPILFLTLVVIGGFLR